MANGVQRLAAVQLETPPHPLPRWLDLRPCQSPATARQLLIRFLWTLAAHAAIMGAPGQEE